ncbi:response regulator [Brevundimonas sp. Leaf363]|uniref:response regulator n=1 Tax=Brevundimonas sp. Leaf363 TaxID=1736353 RepID=UPI0006F20C5B|nr:response regulator [Brevundimonas sp. Leaf363]KQS54421.1 response regulator [Brevundimonas sp. Leaf363]
MTHKALRVVIVEDEAILVMDIEAMVEDLGHVVVAEAASLQDVEKMALDPAPDLAFVDMQLARGSSGLDVCALILDRWPNTAVVFVTANPAMLPDDFLGAHGVIPKPFSRAGLMSAMRFLEEGILDPPPSIDSPPSFVASPRISAEWAAH